MTSTPSTQQPTPLFQKLAWGLVILAALALVIIRFTGPPDLMENDQQAPASYVLDAVVNGHWLVQHDDAGNICYKPPLYVWLAAAGMKLSGQLCTFWLYLPNALAISSVAFLLFVWGKNVFSLRAGMFAALTFLLCHLSVKHVALARTDALFAFTVALAAFAAYRAWRQENSWFWFWLACAATTLTKGPLGILLAASGLLAAAWEREPRGLKGTTRAHLLGLALFALICGGWWWLAYQAEGSALADKMLKQELVTHAVTAKADGKYWRDLFKPTGYFCGRFAPWFLLTLVQVWRVIRKPSSDRTQRALERFLVCWLGLGWLVFSLSPHHRPDHIVPLLAPAALLAGLTLSRWLNEVTATKLLAGTAAVAVSALVAVQLYYGRFRPNPEILRQTSGMISLATQWRATATDGRQLTHMDSPYALQFYLGTMQRKVSPERAAELLRGNAPAFVAVQDGTELDKLLAGLSLTEVARWPKTGEPFVRIVTNLPQP